MVPLSSWTPGKIERFGRTKPGSLYPEGLGGADPLEKPISMRRNGAAAAPGHKRTKWAREWAIKRRPRIAEESGGFVPPGGTVERSADKRRNSRIRTHFETSYSSGREDGSGILANISYSGALLTHTSIQPRLGSQVRVYVLLSEDSPFEIVGQVVRHGEDGFAI